MKRSLRLVVGVIFGVTMLAVFGSSKAEAVTGPHNMSGKAPGGQVCIVCHAPHGAPKSPLLWNHTLSAATYSWSDWTKTTGDTSLPTNISTWSGSTKMCLSCHDGTVDIGSIYMPASDFDATKINADARVGASGDLKGNHPVAVPYPYNGAKNTYNGITTGTLALASGWVAAPTSVKLYTDAAAAAPNNRGMECSSCHDPHGTANSDYLRDTGSNLCLDCHTK